MFFRLTNLPVLYMNWFVLLTFIALFELISDMMLSQCFVFIIVVWCFKLIANCLTELKIFWTLSMLLVHLIHHRSVPTMITWSSVFMPLNTWR